MLIMIIKPNINLGGGLISPCYAKFSKSDRVRTIITLRYHYKFPCLILPCHDKYLQYQFKLKKITFAH